jgi:integrase
MLVARRAIGDTNYVFPAESASGYIAEPKFYFNQVYAATGIRVSPHDLRRTFATIAARCGIGEYLMRALVNHSLGRDVTSGYIDMLAEELREPMQRVADKIKQLCGVKEPHGENVAKMR